MTIFHNITKLVMYVYSVALIGWTIQRAWCYTLPYDATPKLSSLQQAHESIQRGDPYTCKTDMYTMFGDMLKLKAPVIQGFAENLYDPVMESLVRLYSIKWHTMSGVVWMLCTLYNVLPRSKDWNNWKLHSIAGNLWMMLAALFNFHGLYLLYVSKYWKVNPPAMVTNTLAYILIVTNAIPGYLALTRGDVQSHKRHMLLASAGVMVNATERLAMITLRKTTNMDPTSWKEFYQGLFFWSTIPVLCVMTFVALIESRVPVPKGYEIRGKAFASKFASSKKE